MEKVPIRSPPSAVDPGWDQNARMPFQQSTVRANCDRSRYWSDGGARGVPSCPIKLSAKAHTQQKRRRGDSSCKAIRSDINVSDVCGCARQVHVLLHPFGLCGDAVLSLSETRFQQGLDLFLTRPQAVLRGKREVSTAKTRRLTVYRK